MAHKALLCGINGYTSVPLRGCVNDVHAVQALLLEHYGFAPEQVRVLLDEACVKTGLLEGWHWLTDAALPGDVLVFHFSGHGSYIPDLEGEEEDLRDEITCLQDFSFDDPESYITDDAWYQLTSAVDPGVHLLIIKDTCHSGGSSRFISVRQNNGLDKTILASTQELSGYQAGEVISEQALSNARFIVPPQLPAEAWQRAGSRRRTKAAGFHDLHTSLMACAEAQTAADAFIDGDYHGAFSHYLCQVLREGGGPGSPAIIREVAVRLQGQYAQTPRHEGRPFTLALLACRGGDDRPLAPANAPAPETFHPTEQVGAEGLNAQQMVYRAHLRFLDTMRALQGAGAERHADQSAVARVLVAVHGIGAHRPGYSDSWWHALRPHVGDLFAPARLGAGRAEVVWSDLVNQQRGAGLEPLDAEARQLRQAILDVIDDRQLQHCGDAQRAFQGGGPAEVALPGGALQQVAVSRGVALAIDDFLIYMLDPAMRRRILARFTDVLRPLLSAGAQLELISHSWGTVVAYEGLRDLEQEPGLSGRVHCWFTVGSALSLPPVQASLRPENRPSSHRLAPKPLLVSEWINLDAQGDHVGGPLGHRFALSREHLNLVPSGCTASWLGYDLGCAHGSYFEAANLRVNREIFADRMLAQS